MSAVDIVRRSGDNQPILRRTLSDANGPINLSNYTVTFQITDPVTGNIVFNDPCDVVDAPNGVVEFSWPNTPTAGFYFAVFKLSNTTDNKNFTIPNSIPLSLMVTDGTTSEYSYTGNPALRTIDKIRFLIQDTDTSSMVLSDSEIMFLSTEFGNDYNAAAEAADIISARYGSFRDKTVGPLSIRYGDVTNRYVQLAKSLRKRASTNSGAVAVFTGTKRDPLFKIGMNDNTNGTYSYDGLVN